MVQVSRMALNSRVLSKGSGISEEVGSNEDPQYKSSQSYALKLLGNGILKQPQERLHLKSPTPCVGPQPCWPG